MERDHLGDELDGLMMIIQVHKIINNQLASQKGRFSAKDLDDYRFRRFNYELFKNDLAA
jgi:hypothetical protein